MPLLFIIVDFSDIWYDCKKTVEVFFMDSSLYLCGIFYAEQKGEESKYANLKGKSSDNGFQEIYWKNMTVMYASARKTNPQAKLCLFTNINPPNSTIKNTLSNLNVSVIILDYKSKPKINNWGFWQSTFYIIDAMEYMKEIMNHNDTVIFLDIDCIVSKSLSDLCLVLQKDGFLSYELQYDENHQVHGISRNELKIMIESTYQNKLENCPKYFGGEIYGIHSKSNVDVLYNKLKEAWELSQNNQQLRFHTEEHLFNYVFAILGKFKGNANGNIKRIWTAYNFRNVEQNDIELDIWHLPSEKKHGMLDVYDDVINSNSDFWKLDGEQWVLYLGNKVTIPHRSLKRVVIDFAKNSVKKSISLLKDA